MAPKRLRRNFSDTESKEIKRLWKQLVRRGGYSHWGNQIFKEILRLSPKILADRSHYGIHEHMKNFRKKVDDFNKFVKDLPEYSDTLNETDSDDQESMMKTKEEIARYIIEHRSDVHEDDAWETIVQELKLEMTGKNCAELFYDQIYKERTEILGKKEADILEALVMDGPILSVKKIHRSPAGDTGKECSPARDTGKERSPADDILRHSSEMNAAGMSEPDSVEQDFANKDVGDRCKKIKTEHPRSKSPTDPFQSSVLQQMHESMLAEQMQADKRDANRPKVPSEKKEDTKRCLIRGKSRGNLTLKTIEIGNELTRIMQMGLQKQTKGKNFAHAYSIAKICLGSNAYALATMQPINSSKEIAEFVNKTMEEKVEVVCYGLQSEDRIEKGIAVGCCKSIQLLSNHLEALEKIEQLSSRDVSRELMEVLNDLNDDGDEEVDELRGQPIPSIQGAKEKPVEASKANPIQNISNYVSKTPYGSVEVIEIDSD